MQRQDHPFLQVVNPLGGALHHYTQALGQTLARSNFRVDIHAFPEPSLRGGKRFGWIYAYIRALMAAKRSADVIISTWPVLGYWDLVILSVLLPGRSILVLHDPIPLVKAIGYGRTSIWFAKKLGARCLVVVHSKSAHCDASRVLVGAGVALAGHPLKQNVGDLRTNRSNPTTPLIRVVGQYKPDRDIPLLEALSSRMPQLTFQVIGRGWPAVEGWNVRNEFVSEQVLDDLLATSSLIVIPYTRFYQSGIAFRALEHGVPFIGPRDSNLADVLPESSNLLYEVGAESEAQALAALHFALTTSAESEIHAAYQRARDDSAKDFVLILERLIAISTGRS